MAFKPSGSVTRSNEPIQDNERKEDTFVRDERDNYLFPEIQVNDITSITRPETKWYWDFDMPVYQVASALEDKRIRFHCKTDKTIKGDAENITAFKGRGKKIPENSWLGVLNIEREVQELEPLTTDDFEIEPYQKLKLSEEKSFEAGKIQIYKKLKETRLQYGINNIIFTWGRKIF